MYPCVYPLTLDKATAHGLYGLLESPSGTKIEKGLALQGLFFACDNVADPPPSRVGAAEGSDL